MSTFKQNARFTATRQTARPFQHHVTLVTSYNTTIGWGRFHLAHPAPMRNNPRYNVPAARLAMSRSLPARPAQVFTFGMQQLPNAPPKIRTRSSMPHLETNSPYLSPSKPNFNFCQYFFQRSHGRTRKKSTPGGARGLPYSTPREVLIPQGIRPYARMKHGPDWSLSRAPSATGCGFAAAVPCRL